MFHVVCLASRGFFFRSPDLSDPFDMIGQNIAGGPSPLVTLPMVFLVVATGQNHRPVNKRQLESRRGVAGGAARWSSRESLSAWLMVAADAAVGQEGVAPFIYFRF